MGCHLRLRWSKFGLTHHRPASFGTAQWQKRETVSVPYLLYRFLVFAFFWGFFIYFLVDTPDDLRPYLMIYLTVWTYMTAMLDVALQLVASCVVAFRHHYGIKPVLSPWLYKTQWVIVNISHTMEPFVTLLYWSTVFPQLDVSVTYSDIHLHLLTTLYTLLDLAIHCSPRRYHHVTFPLGFSLSYLLFTFIYYLCDGRAPDGSSAVYPVLDWAKPGLTWAAAAGAMLAIFVLHGLTWGVVQLRLRLHGRWHGENVSLEAGLRPAASGDEEDGGGDGDGERGDADGGEGGGEKHEEFYDNVDVGDGKGGEAKTIVASDDKVEDEDKALDNEAAVMGEDVDSDSLSEKDLLLVV